MKLIVNQSQRYAKMRAHTATHLLHFALDQLLSWTKQAGSLVDEDYLRFDFAAKQALTNEQIASLQEQINAWIYAAHPVTVAEMNYDDALQAWAKAFFEDKYGDRVRLVSVEWTDLISKELCWWTHVTNTRDIGSFAIIAQESVASGIRRIIAVTGTKVAAYAQELENFTYTLAEKLNCQPKQVEEKIDKVLKAYEQLQANFEQAQTLMIAQQLQNADTIASDEFDTVINLSHSSLKDIPLKTIVNQAKQLWPEKNWLLFTNEWNFACYKADGTAKVFAKKHNLKWGGSEQLIQGRDETVRILFI